VAGALRDLGGHLLQIEESAATGWARDKLGLRVAHAGALQQRKRGVAQVGEVKAVVRLLVEPDAADAAGSGLDLAYLRETSFALLQGSRMRNTKTEFVSCPSCGRTLFDLQEVTAQIAERTGHLPGVAIAIMGCIVNGPGEMADADFGYVGGAPGKVDLYVGKEMVQRAIPNDDACDALIELIKDNGMWKDKEEEEVTADEKEAVLV